MTHLERLISHVNRRGAVFYVEHNDFLSGNISIEEELDDLLEEGSIDDELAERCRAENSIWSIRYHSSPGSFDIVYHVSLEGAASEMNFLLGLD